MPRTGQFMVLCKRSHLDFNLVVTLLCTRHFSLFKQCQIPTFSNTRNFKTRLNINSLLTMLIQPQGYFWLFLENPEIQVPNCQHHCQQGSVHLQQLVVASAEVLEKSQIFQKCAKCTLTLMSNYEIIFSSRKQELLKCFSIFFFFQL